MGDWFDEGGNGSPLEACHVLSAEAIDDLLRMVSSGALVSLGLTGDKGALGVTVTVDKKRRKGWFRTVDEADAWITEAEPHVSSAAREASVSYGQRERSRR